MSIEYKVSREYDHGNRKVALYLVNYPGEYSEDFAIQSWMEDGVAKTNVVELHNFGAFITLFQWLQEAQS